MIETRALAKRFRSRESPAQMVHAVRDVSFVAPDGAITGLLGPNGAGKTTSFYQVVGLVKPDSGDVFLDDLNIRFAKLRL